MHSQVNINMSPMLSQIKPLESCTLHYKTTINCQSVRQLDIMTIKWPRPRLQFDGVTEDAFTSSLHS